MRLQLHRSIALVLFLAAARLAWAQGVPGFLIGDVVSRETGLPLGHAMVTLLGAQRQTFSSEAGVFAFRDLDPGRYRLHVTRIGYVPLDVDATVPADAAPARLKVALEHLAVKIAGVKVLAVPTCTAPGRPDPSLDSNFAAIILQLRLNAEHYKLLTDSFPFAYAVQRLQAEMKRDGRRSTPHIDTLTYRTDHFAWEYQVGDMVVKKRDGTYAMHLPDLRDFASYEFLNNHCFHFAGLDSTRDGVMLRIDFRADIQIRKPDVNGAIYLDAQSYQIRRADLELTKIPADAGDIAAVHVTTLFKEISPSIAMIHDVNGVNAHRHSVFPWAPVAFTEDQRMVHFEWLHGDPAHPAVQP